MYFNFNIEEFKDKYHVNSYGKIFKKPSVVTRKSKLGKINNYEKPGFYLKPYKTNSGYFMVDIHLNNKRYKAYIHRIVAYLYCNLDKEKTVVNHKDGNKLNNNYSNLEWVTSSENSLHSSLNKLTSNHRLDEFQIYNIKLWRKLGFKNKEIGYAYKRSALTICRVINNKYTYSNNFNQT